MPDAYLHQPQEAALRWMGETSTYFIADGERTGGRRHGEFYRAITLPAQPDGSPPEQSIEGPQLKQASQTYGIEFVGPLPDDS